MGALGSTESRQGCAKNNLSKKEGVRERRGKEVYSILCIALVYRAAIERPLEIRALRRILGGIGGWNANQKAELMVNVLFTIAAIADEV